MKVFHCFTNIGGNAIGLSNAQKLLRIDSEMVSLVPHKLGYDSDRVLNPDLNTPAILRMLRRYQFFLEVLQKADLVHFYFGDSLLTTNRFPNRNPKHTGVTHKLAQFHGKLMWMRDLPLLKARGIRIAMTFLGGDIRLVSHVRKHHAESHLLEEENLHFHETLDADRRSLIACADRYADLIYATNPDLLEILPDRAQYLPYTSVRPEEFTVLPVPLKGPLKIAHAPTNRATKGTEIIIDVIKELKNSDYGFEFDLIENTNSKEARRRIEASNLFIDQLKVGWYGGACVEAMSAGAIPLAYIRPADLEFSPHEFTLDATIEKSLAAADSINCLPVFNVNTVTLIHQLKLLLSMDRQQLQYYSNMAVNFSNIFHHPLTIAKAVIEDYRSIG